MSESPKFGLTTAAFASLIKENGLSSDLAKPIKVQLSNKGTEIVMLEKFRDAIRGKYFAVFNHEHITLFGPAAYAATCLVAAVDHGKSF